MTAEDIKAYCLSKHKACETYPFGKVPVCYKLNDKIFAQLYPDEENYKITLKCTADAAQFYRMVYPDKIVEGYHCSRVQKPYWNTIYLEILHMIPYCTVSAKKCRNRYWKMYDWLWGEE